MSENGQIYCSGCGSTAPPVTDVEEGLPTVTCSSCGLLLMAGGPPEETTHENARVDPPTGDTERFLQAEGEVSWEAEPTDTPTPQSEPTPAMEPTAEDLGAPPEPVADTMPASEATPLIESAPIADPEATPIAPLAGGEDEVFDAFENQPTIPGVEPNLPPDKPERVGPIVGVPAPPADLAPSEADPESRESTPLEMPAELAPEPGDAAEAGEDVPPAEEPVADGHWDASSAEAVIAHAVANADQPPLPADSNEPPSPELGDVEATADAVVAPEAAPSVAPEATSEAELSGSPEPGPVHTEEVAPAIALPDPEPPMAPAAPQELILEEEITPIPQALGTVLAAEDDELLRNLIIDTLTERELARRVVGSTNGEQFLTQYLSSVRAGDVPHLAILDVGMPILSGINAAIALRAIERARGVPPVPILFFTAAPMSEPFKRVLQFTTPARYLNKGAGDPKQFAERVYQALYALLTGNQPAAGPPGGA